MAGQVQTFALKQRMRFDLDFAEQIAARSTAGPRFAFASDTELHPGIDTRGNVDAQLDRFRFVPGASAFRALVANHLACAATSPLSIT